VLARVVKVSPSSHCRTKIASRRLQPSDFEHPTTYIIFNFTPRLNSR
jgi:hypothetical protein